MAGLFFLFHLSHWIDVNLYFWMNDGIYSLIALICNLVFIFSAGKLFYRLKG
jgi:hypothetical protein